MQIHDVYTFLHVPTLVMLADMVGLENNIYYKNGPRASISIKIL